MHVHTRTDIFKKKISLAAATANKKKGLEFSIIVLDITWV
jgi:hypothetical protein